MFEAYRIGIAVALTGNVSSALGMWKKQFEEAGTMTSSLQKRMDDLRTTGKKAALEIGAGFLVLKPFGTMISDAAKLQKEMIGIGLGARGSADDLNRLRGVIEDVAGKTMFSNIDVAEMAKKLATGTGWTRRQIMSDLPVFAQFADAQQIMKGTPYSESVKTGITLSHLAGYNKPEDISHYLDQLTKASMVVPGGLGEVAHALKYSQAVLKNTLGMSDDNTILLVTLLNRMGLGGSRGGTTLTAALTRSIPGIFGSGLLKGKSLEALEKMGMADRYGHSTVFRNGKFDALVWMSKLADYENMEYSRYPEATARQHILENMQHAFGVNGSRGTALFATPQARTALEVVRNQLANGSGTAMVQQTFADQSVLQQFNNAKTNITTLMSELGYKLLPDASAALRSFNTEISKLTDWVRDPKHEGVVKTAEYGVAGVGGLLTVGGILNGVKWALGGLGLTKTAAGAAVNTATKASIGGLVGGGLVGGEVVYQAGKGAFDQYHNVGERWAARSPEAFSRFASIMERLSFGLLKRDDQPIQVNVNLDGKQITSVLTNRMTDRLWEPNRDSGLSDFRIMPLYPGGY